MDSTTGSGSILDTLRTVEFRLNLKGYNVDEVDEYLEKAAVEAEALHEQVRQMTERVRQATERIATLESERRERPAPTPAAEVREESGPRVSDDTLQRTLLLAQQFVDQTKRESESEAADRVAKAEEKARSVVAEAEERARTLTTEAEQRLREEVTRLEAMRGQLSSDVENMARQLEQERTRLRGALGDMLKWVEENVQPANALMASRPRTPDGPRPGTGATRPGDGAPGATGAATPGEGAARPVADSGTPVSGPNGSGTPERRPESGSGAQVLDLRGPTSGDRP